MFTKNFATISDNLIETTKKIIAEGKNTPKQSNNPSSEKDDYDWEDRHERDEIDRAQKEMDSDADRKKVAEASNEEPTINHLELTEDKERISRLIAAARRTGKPVSMKSIKAQIEREKTAKISKPKKTISAPKATRDSDDDEGPHTDPETGEKDLVPARKHIMNQLRQAAQSMKAQHSVTFSDGKTHHVAKSMAKDLVNHYDSLDKPYKKEQLQSQLGKSHDDLIKHHQKILGVNEASDDSTKLKPGQKVLYGGKLTEVPVEDGSTANIKTLNAGDGKVNEREMTDAEKAKREKIVMRLKDKIQDFRKKYGAKAKNVMYATATKLAMKEETPRGGKTSTGQPMEPVEKNPSMPTKEIGASVKSGG